MSQISVTKLGHIASTEYDDMYKIVIIGDSAVGKTSLCQRFDNGAFHEDMLSTVGVDFFFQMIQIASKTVKLQVWDTAGQERFRTMKSSYYRRCDGILVVFDITNGESFQRTTSWLDEINQHCPTGTVDLLLLGNKADLASDRQVSMVQAVDWTTENHIPAFSETSAKDGTGVDAAFLALAGLIYDRVGIRQQASSRNQKVSLVEDQLSQKQKMKKCC